MGLYVCKLFFFFLVTFGCLFFFSLLLFLSYFSLYCFLKRDRNDVDLEGRGDVEELGGVK